MKTKKYFPTEKVVIITGGAGQLGSMMCKHFDELFNLVYMADLSKELCESKIKELSLKNTRALELDITSINSIKRGFRQVMKEQGRIDILVNNAGIAVFTSFEERTPEEFEKVMKVNLFGTFFCTQEVLKYMVRGNIINIGSVYGVVSPDPRIYGDSGRNSSEIYGATKAGVIHMTKYLAVHIKNKDIKINCISPGGVFNNQKDFFIKNYEAKTPMKRMASPEEIARVTVSICSDAFTYLSGQNIIVDGGFSIW